jgi:hypothetical protein
LTKLLTHGLLSVLEMIRSKLRLPRRWHLFASAFLFPMVEGFSRHIFQRERIKRGFCPNVAKILEIIVARKTVFDIFRAPFDRNRCDGILAG